MSIQQESIPSRNLFFQIHFPAIDLTSSSVGRIEKDEARSFSISGGSSYETVLSFYDNGVVWRCFYTDWEGRSHIFFEYLAGEMRFDAYTASIRDGLVLSLFLGYWIEKDSFRVGWGG